LQAPSWSMRAAGSWVVVGAISSRDDLSHTPQPVPGVLVLFFPLLLPLLQIGLFSQARKPIEISLAIVGEDCDLLQQTSAMMWSPSIPWWFKPREGSGFGFGYLTFSKVQIFFWLPLCIIGPLVSLHEQSSPTTPQQFAACDIPKNLPNKARAKNIFKSVIVELKSFLNP